MLSVIVPVYNRLENLKLCLEGLKQQKDAPDFDITVVDDGSTDEMTLWLVQWMMNNAKLDMKYMSGGPNKGFRGGRARNIGAFNCKGDRIVFVDSDVVLNEYALSHYWKAHEALPNAIIVGRYDWLPPLAWNESNRNILWESTELSQILNDMQRGAVDRLPNDDNSPFGVDVRTPDFDDDLTKTGKGAGLGALSGNISYPYDLFHSLGGFDEAIVGHGGEDADLGLTADERQVDWKFYRPIIGFHVWHPRDQERNSKEVQRNINYIDRKHGIGQYASAKKWTDSMDPADPQHYHRDLGAIVLKLPNNPTVYVCRPDLQTRLGVTSQQWLARLGFTHNDVQLTTEFILDKFIETGATVER